jgi:hypothetical protein
MAPEVCKGESARTLPLSPQYHPRLDWCELTCVHNSFRWLFIIEGIITLLSAFLLLFFLPDYPARAKWLSPSDKQFAEDRLKERGGGYLRSHASRHEVLATFFSPRMLAHYLAYVSPRSNKMLSPCRKPLTHTCDVDRWPMSCLKAPLPSLHRPLSRAWVILRQSILRLPCATADRDSQHPCPTPHRPALVRRLRRCNHSVLQRRPLQRTRPSHQPGLNRGRRGLACSRSPPGRRLRIAVRLLVSRSVWRFPCGSFHDELGDLQYPFPLDHPIRCGSEQQLCRHWADHRAMDLEGWRG